MEFYSHQQQQQSQQQVDSMATNAASSTTTAAANSSNNRNTPPTSSTTINADAATVAAAKDMLQLHHGGAHNSNNNISSSSNNNSAAEHGMILHRPANANAAGGSTSPTAVVTTTTNAATELGESGPPDNAVGFLKYDGDLLYITERTTVIGRNSSTSNVHFHVAENNLVSRKHFQVVYESNAREFFVECLSKNGIFVDDFLQRRNLDPYKLPGSCFFRFPSTEIRIQFESFLQPAPDSSVAVINSGANFANNHHHPRHAPMPPTTGGGVVIISSTAPDGEQQSHHQQQQHMQQQQQQQHTSHHPHHNQPQQQQHSSGNASMHLLPMDSGNVIYSPLKISIPKKEQKSPYLSPTGTISAANSCPASPRQGFHQNQSNYNYSNNNQDLFQTPSTASYNHNEKPPYSYAQLIVQAISAAPDKQLTLSGIYSFIVQHYPYYRKETNKGWQNSIRHNLSLNRYFIKVARSQDEPGKGSFWRIDPDSGAKLIDHSYKKRRQRSSQGFRPSYGMPRSAPVSPSHMDNSRESSPLQDIVLQSAPGSPGMSIENRATDADLIYNAQNMHHQTVAGNNSHAQYNSPYYVSTQNAAIAINAGQQQKQHQQSHVDSSSGGGGISSGNGSVGALIALKRSHVMPVNIGGNTVGGLHRQQQQQTLHPEIIYEEMPTDYSGNMESGDDECDGGASKRPKYVSEVL